jgi:trk system potassium uptake protein TrkA
MQFLIIGAGRVGLRTARVLREEGYEVTIVDIDSDRAERARDNGFTVVEGDGSHESVLEEAGIHEASALGALTPDLNANFAACMVANHHGCRTVMRIDDDYREEIYRTYADQVDEIVYPERLGAIGAKNALLGGNIQAIADIAADLQVSLFTITRESPMMGYTISEVELPAKSRLLAFGKRDEAMSIPLPDDTLEPGDRIAVLTEIEALDTVRQLLVGEQAPATAEGGE